MADHRERKVVRSPSRKVAATPPTKVRLIECAIELLGEHFLEEITTDMILQHSSVSRGSLYHHFEDLSDLMEQALVRKFSGYVDASVDALAKFLQDVHSAGELFAKLMLASGEIHSEEGRANRHLLSQLAGLADGNDRLTRRLAREQKRLTAALADLFTQSQRRGWMSQEFDPRVAAVLVQAHVAGRVVDDISEEKVTPREWDSFIGRAIRLLFL